MDKILHDIKSLKIQGAREIAKVGINYLSEYIKKSGAKKRKQLLFEMEMVINKLINLRITEPALKNSLLSIFIEVKNAQIKDINRLKHYILKVCKNKIHEFERNIETVSKIGSKLLDDGDYILTHCHSHLVVGILKQAKMEGKNFTVIVTETRPKNQGIITLRDLSSYKIKMIYCVDSAIGYVMKDVTKILVGCDAILPDGSIVNKIGTLPIAIVAKKFGKPFYVAGETIKFIESVKIEERNPEEVLDTKLPGLKIINPAFDIVPSEFITEIITENGIKKPEMISEIVSKNFT